MCDLVEHLDGRMPMIDPVTSYTELIGAIHAEIQRLGVRSLDFDELAGFAPGLSGKVFGMLQVKRLGPEKLFDAIRAAGLRLRVEIDPEQQAKMIERIANNFNPRQANQARNGHASSLPSTPVLNRVMQPFRKIGGKKRWQRKSPKERSAHMTMMINARWKRVRKLSKAARKGVRTRKQRLALMPKEERAQ